MAKYDDPMTYEPPKPRHRERVQRKERKGDAPLKEGVPFSERMKRDTTDGYY